MGLKRYENLAQIYEKEGGMGRADGELVDVGKLDPNYDPKFTINGNKIDDSNEGGTIQNLADPWKETIFEAKAKEN